MTRSVSPARRNLPLCAAVALATAITCACALRTTTRTDHGILPCPATAAAALLTADALQCWFAADHGRWRILSHVAFHDALVVQIETNHLRDADEIARRFVGGEGRHFSEILVYARTESPRASSKVRRVRWTRTDGFAALEFTS